MTGLMGAVLLVVFGTVDYPQPTPNDHWSDIISTNGKTIWLDQDRIWQDQQRVYAVVRIVPANTDQYLNATDVIVATDCRTSLKAFGTYEDYRNAPLDPARGMGQAMMQRICHPQG
jgi:hypothetical protein